MTGWKERNVYEWKDNPFEAIGKDWMLVTAGTREDAVAACEQAMDTARWEE